MGSGGVIIIKGKIKRAVDAVSAAGKRAISQALVAVNTTVPDTSIRYWQVAVAILVIVAIVWAFV